MTVSDETLTLRKSMNMRARSERAWKILAFSHSKTAISFNILEVGTSDTLSQKHIYFQVSNYNLHDTYHQCSSLLLLIYGMALYIQTTVYRQNTDIEKIYEYARKKLHFHILKLLFPSIFCWYFWYFISETYIFSGLKLQSAWYIYHQCSSLFLLMVWRYKTTVYRQNTNIENIYKYASELGKFLHLHILKLLFLSIFCWNFWYFISETYIYFQVSNYNLHDTSSMQFPVSMALLYSNDSIPTKHWHWENLWICERKKLHFHILKLLFPSIFF